MTLFAAAAAAITILKKKLHQRSDGRGGNNHWARKKEPKHRLGFSGLSKRNAETHFPNTEVALEFSSIPSICPISKQLMLIFKIQI